jgi:hypothetical protein
MLVQLLARKRNAQFGLGVIVRPPKQQEIHNPFIPPKIHKMLQATCKEEKCSKEF